MNSTARETLITADSGACKHAALLHGWLRDGCAWTLAEEYPSVFAPGSRARSTTLERDGEVLAHAATLDVEHITRDAAGEHQLALRLVGSVVVSPQHRGTGLGRTLMRSVVDDFRASTRDLLVLWSDKAEFYARFGFAPWGRELLMLPHKRRPSSRIRPARPDDAEWLASTHAQKARRVKRSAAEFEALLRTPRLQTWVLERDAQSRAYACVGKGMDYENVAHETGGDDDALGELLCALPIRFAVLPRERQALARRYGRSYPNPLALAQARVRLGDRDLEAALRLSIEGLDSI